MLASFLRDRGFLQVDDRRTPHGKDQSQSLHAIDETGTQVAMRVRMCWHRKGDMSESDTSAAQLLSKVKNGDWIGTLNEKVRREQAAGITHFLLVQRAADQIVRAASVPISAVVPIWIAQRDVSLDLVARGEMGRRKKNHAMNGSSPTVWLQDNRAPSVATALWDFPGVRDLANLPLVGPKPSGAPEDDSIDDLPGVDYATFGSDGAQRVERIISGVKRDPRVRAQVMKRSGGTCEREGCGERRTYSGFLDVHHILGAEKSDRVWNCVALCPNCHRETHAAPGRDEINRELLKFAQQFKRGR